MLNTLAKPKILYGLTTSIKFVLDVAQPKVITRVWSNNKSMWKIMLKKQLINPGFVE